MTRHDQHFILLVLASIFYASGLDGSPSGDPGRAQSDLSGLAFSPRTHGSYREHESQMTDRWHNFFEDGAVCFCTSSIIERIPALRSPTAARCFLGIVDEYRRRYGVRLLAYVVMPDMG